MRTLNCIDDLSPLIDRYKAEIEKSGKWTWEGMDEVLESSGVDLGWLLTPFIQSLIEIYLFTRPHASLAFDEPYERQPQVWVETKLLLDGIFG